MTYEQAQTFYGLTTLEEVKALIDAGIDPNIDTWDEETLNRASDVLDAAQKAKIEHLTHNSPCKCGHKRGSHNRFINGLFVGCQLCDCELFDGS